MTPHLFRDESGVEYGAHRVLPERHPLPVGPRYQLEGERPRVLKVIEVAFSSTPCFVVNGGLSWSRFLFSLAIQIRIRTLSRILNNFEKR